MQPLELDTGTTVKVMVSYVAPGKLGERGEIHFKHRGAFTGHITELRAQVLDAFRDLTEVTFSSEFWVLDAHFVNERVCGAICEAINSVFQASSHDEGNQIVVQQDDSVSAPPSATPSARRRGTPRDRRYVNRSRR